MTTQYTPILKLALPVTGELSGTWGDVVNDNITSMVEQAIAGLATISTWTGNSHTLTTANGTTSESRCAMLVAQNGAGLTAAGEIVCPASSKLYVLKNDTSYTITLKTAAGTGVAVVSGNTAFLFCDGTNVNACVTTIVDGRVTGNLTVDGNATVNGNTTLGNATSDTITATARFNTDLLPSTDNARDLGSTANSWKDLYIDGTATMALVAISGGTINGVSIGATTPATFIAVDNLSLDGNTIASTNTNGNVVIAPNGTGDVQLDADTVRVGDSGAAATLTSNGAGALTVTTGGAADLTLSTNSGTTSGTIVIANGAGGNITLTPEGTGDVILSADRVQIGDANTDTTLTTNGTGSLNLTTNNGTNSGTIQIAQGANGNITLTPNGTGSVSVPKLVWSNGTATRVPYLTTGGQFTDSANLTFNGTDLTVSGAVNAGSVNATTLDLTNLEVTNIKAKDGTASITLADSTGVASFSANPILSGGTANGVAYLNGSKVLTTGSALTFDGTNLGIGVAGSSPLSFASATGQKIRFYNALTGYGIGVESSEFRFVTDNSAVFTWGIGTYASPSEQMRLASTGLTVQQGAVFNESGANSDFRVESDNTTHMLFINAASDKVAIGSSAVYTRLTVSNGNSARTGITLSDANTASMMLFAGNSSNGVIAVDSTVGIDFQTAANVGQENGTVRARIGGVGGPALSTFGSAVLASGTTIDPDTYPSQVIAGNISDGSGFAGIGIGLSNSSAGQTGAIVLAGGGMFFGLGDGASANSMLGVLDMSRTAVVFNENSSDIDFRIESDTNTHAFFLDAGNSRIGINQSAPETQLHIGNTSTTTSQMTLAGEYQSGTYSNTNIINFQHGAFVRARIRSSQYAPSSDSFVLNMEIANGSLSGYNNYLKAYGTSSDTGGEVVINDDGLGQIDFRVESDTSTHMLFVDASANRVGINASSPTETLDVDGSTRTRAWDFDNGTINAAPAFNSGLWSSYTIASPTSTITTASFNGKTASVWRMANSNNSQWNYTRVIDYAENTDANFPSEQNYAVFEFWWKNNGGTNTNFTGFIAEGDFWGGAPSRSASAVSTGIVVDGWTLYRAVMQMASGKYLNYGFGFDYNRAGADSYFAFPKFFIAGGQRGAMQGGLPIFMSQNTGNMRLFGRFASVNQYGIGLGTDVVASSGTGITFPATQSASSNANTLDDYEEGTWTPTIEGTTTDPSGISYTQQYGRYTKVGNVVYLSFRVAFTFTNGTGSGAVAIRGIPFTPSNNPQPKATPQQDNITYTGFTYLDIAATQNNTWLGLGKNRSGSSASSVVIGDCSSSGTDINGGVYYFV